MGGRRHESRMVAQPADLLYIRAMADPDNIVLEHLRAIHAELAEIKRELETQADAVHLADIERKLVDKV
jgi:hypothetical protein